MRSQRSATRHLKTKRWGPSCPLVSRSSMPADMTMLADHTARQLLDFSQKLDINLLDNVVNSMYYDVGSQVCGNLLNPRRL